MKHAGIAKKSLRSISKERLAANGLPSMVFQLPEINMLEIVRGVCRIEDL
jgi:hypothetical protein